MAEDDFGLISYKIFRPIAKKYAKLFFKELKNDLRRANMRLTIEEYFSEFLLVESVVMSVFLIASFLLISINCE